MNRENNSVTEELLELVALLTADRRC